MPREATLVVTVIFLIAIGGIVGIITQLLLYRAATNAKNAPPETEEDPGRVLGHTQDVLIKYQEAVQEKNKELTFMKRSYEVVKQQFEHVRQQFVQVEGEKKQTEAVVKSVAEGLVIVNHKGEVLLMNPSAEKMLGVSKEIKMGHSILEDVPEALMVSLTHESGENGEKVIELKSKNENTKRVLRASTAIIQNENGQTVGMLNVLTDVTQQKAAEGAKTSFISNVTHELRTPIVAMQKATALLTSLQAGPLNETQANFLNIVSRNLGHLNQLVEDLLDIAKIDSGKMHVRMIKGPIEKVLNEVCDSLGTWAKSKSIKLLIEIEKGFPEFDFDPDKIRQVLNNLLSNAIKFTPPGGTITIKARLDPAGDNVLISVIDTGPGIAKENMSKLFKRFEQFGTPSEIEGTGLGLSITKEIVNRHRGVITVESEPDKGANFTFSLPLSPATPGDQI